MFGMNEHTEVLDSKQCCPTSDCSNKQSNLGLHCLQLCVHNEETLLKFQEINHKVPKKQLTKLCLQNFEKLLIDTVYG